MKVNFVQTVKTGMVWHCADNVDLHAATAIHCAANVPPVCGVMCVSGTWSGT